jgi:hypothetical protein
LETGKADPETLLEAEGCRGNGSKVLTEQKYPVYVECKSPWGQGQGWGGDPSCLTPAMVYRGRQNQALASAPYKPLRGR